MPNKLLTGTQDFSWPVWMSSSSLPTYRQRRLQVCVVILCLAMMLNNNIKNIDFKKLLRAALQNNFFNFEGKIYKQIDGVALGSPLRSYFGRCIFVSMNKFGLMNVLMDSNLHTTEDMLMTYFCFVHLIILKNSKTT